MFIPFLEIKILHGSFKFFQKICSEGQLIYKLPKILTQLLISGLGMGEEDP